MRMKGQMRGECCRHEYRGAVGAKRGRGGLTRSGSRSECCRHDTGGTVGHESDRGGANAVLLLLLLNKKIMSGVSLRTNC